MTETNPAAVAQAIATVTAKVGSVEKRGTNDFHRYKYATAADIMHKLQPLMAEHGLVVIHTEMDREFVDNGAALAVRYQFTLAHISGAVWPDRPVMTGLSACRNSKGGFDDKAVNKCLTAAHKYFLLTLFKIPTGDYDDADSEEDKPTTQKKTNGGAKGKLDDFAGAPHDAETGEVKKHFVPLEYDGNNEPLWPDWIARVGTKLKNAPTEAEIDGTLADNKVALANLDKLGEGGKKNATKLRKTAEDRRGELRRAEPNAIAA